MSQNLCRKLVLIVAQFSSLDIFCKLVDMVGRSSIVLFVFVCKLASMFEFRAQFHINMLICYALGLLLRC